MHFANLVRLQATPCYSRARTIADISIVLYGFHTDRAKNMVVEPLGSHLLVTATVEGQMVKVITRTDFPARPGAPIWLEPEPDKLRWLRAADGMAIGV